MAGNNSAFTGAGGVSAPSTPVDAGATQVEDDKLIEDINDASAKNIETGKELEANRETQVKEDEEYVEDKTLRDEEYFNNQNDLIKKNEEEQSRIDTKQISRFNDRINRDTSELTDKKNSEIDYLNTQKEYQKTQNEATIREAKANVEIEKMKGAWSYQKFGLGFSSGIINQSQKIATDGIVKIADIKAKMTMDEATSDYNIAKIEFDYTNLINENIDKYIDAITSVQTEAKKRINEANSNKLKNNYDKNASIEETKKWYREEKRKADTQHIKDMEVVRDKGLVYAKEVEDRRTVLQNQAKSTINDAISNGSIFSMSESRLIELANKSGISLNELNSVKKSAIASSVTKTALTIMGEDYIINEVQRDEINNGVKSLMTGGKTLEEATQIATNKVLSSTPEYKERVSMKELETKYNKKKIESALIALSSSGSSRGGGGSSGSSEYEFSGADFQKEVSSDGRVGYINRITKEFTPAYEITEYMSREAVGQGKPNYLSPDGIIYGDVKRRGEVPVFANEEIKNRGSEEEDDVVNSIFD